MEAISSNKDSQCLNYCAISADLFLVIINWWGDDYPDSCLASMIWLLTDMSFYSTPKLHEIFIQEKEKRKSYGKSQQHKASVPIIIIFFEETM